MFLLRRESVADVVSVLYSPSTGVCLSDLSRLLSLYSNRKLKVGSFSAASNVTGVLTAVDSVSAMMHRAGGLVFFDYATAAPYIKVKLSAEQLANLLANQGSLIDSIMLQRFCKV